VREDAQSRELSFTADHDGREDQPPARCVVARAPGHSRESAILVPGVKARSADIRIPSAFSRTVSANPCGLFSARNIN
jgi:hypothetical protein